MTSNSKKSPRRWSPHIWEGADFFAWFKLLAKNRFAVHPKYWYVAGIVSVVSFGHSILRWLQEGRFGDQIRQTRLAHDPIFIIGHWRAGTTLLHEWMILDPQFNYPNTYQCFEPNHFLLTENAVKRWLWFLMPDRRPMDNMAAGWDRPQEDEFALCMLGQPSPYLKIGFPNRPEPTPGALDLNALNPRELRAWKRAFHQFVQTLTFRDPRQLVLKSPPHTCRIPHLLEMFPRAKFVHIVRDPYVIFPSTVNLWKSLYRQHGLQIPRFAGLEEEVMQTFPFLYERLEEGKKLLGKTQFHELKYEELVADPVGEMRKVYDQLQLDNFAELESRLRPHLEHTKGYRTNKYELSSAQREEICRRWAAVIERYGYDHDRESELSLKRSNTVNGDTDP